METKKEVKGNLRADLNDGMLRKVERMAGENLERSRRAAVLSFSRVHVRKLEAPVEEGNKIGFMSTARR